MFMVKVIMCVVLTTTEYASSSSIIVCTLRIYFDANASDGTPDGYGFCREPCNLGRIQAPLREPGIQDALHSAMIHDFALGSNTSTYYLPVGCFPIVHAASVAVARPALPGTSGVAGVFRWHRPEVK